MASRRRAVAAGAMAGLLLAGPGWGGPATERLRAFFADANAILLAADPENGPEGPRQAVRALINEAFDFREAAALALGAQWRARTAAEQAEFVRLFAELLERGFVAMVGSKARLTGGLTIHYRGESAAGEAATVRTALLTRSGDELPVDYRMVFREGRWAVRDVILDGVSLVATYQAQFQRVIRASSYADLVERMRAMTSGAPVLAAAAAPASPAPDPRRPAPLLVAEAAMSDAPRVSPSPLRPRRPDPEPSPSAPVLVSMPAALAPAVEPVRVVPAPPPAAVPAAPATGARPEARPVASSARPSVRPASRAYWVQVGAFRSVEALTRLVERLAQHPVSVFSAPAAAGQPAGALARVLVGPFHERAAAAAKLRELLSRGHRAFIAETAD